MTDKYSKVHQCKTCGVDILIECSLTMLVWLRKGKITPNEADEGFEDPNAAAYARSGMCNDCLGRWLTAAFVLNNETSAVLK